MSQRNTFIPVQNHPMENIPYQHNPAEQPIPHEQMYRQEARELNQRNLEHQLQQQQHNHNLYMKRMKEKSQLSGSGGAVLPHPGAGNGVNGPPNGHPEQISGLQNPQNQHHKKIAQAIQCIVDLRSEEPEKKAKALNQLSKQRDVIPDLAIYLWESYFTTTLLMQEIFKMYEMVYNRSYISQVNDKVINNVNNAISLIRICADHSYTRIKLVESRIPIILYPYLNIVSEDHYGYRDKDERVGKMSIKDILGQLRSHVLMVIFCLVKAEDYTVTKFLIDTEYMPKGIEIITAGTRKEKLISTAILRTGCLERKENGKKLQ